MAESAEWLLLLQHIPTWYVSIGACTSMVTSLQHFIAITGLHDCISLMSVLLMMNLHCCIGEKGDALGTV